jgi:hypothetical protein
VIRSVVLEKKQKDFVAPACYEPETHCYVYWYETTFKGVWHEISTLGFFRESVSSERTSLKNSFYSASCNCQTRFKNEFIKISIPKYFWTQRDQHVFVASSIIIRQLYFLFWTLKEFQGWELRIVNHSFIVPRWFDFISYSSVPPPFYTLYAFRLQLLLMNSFILKNHYTMWRKRKGGEERIDGRKNGQKEGKTGEKKDRRTEGRMEGREGQVKRRTDGRKDGQKERKDRWKEGQTDRRTDGREGKTGEKKDRRTGGRTEKKRDREIDRRIHGQIDRQTDINWRTKGRIFGWTDCLVDWSYSGSVVQMFFSHQKEKERIKFICISSTFFCENIYLFIILYR